MEERLYPALIIEALRNFRYPDPVQAIEIIGK